jgi:hypothetical protein
MTMHFPAAITRAITYERRCVAYSYLRAGARGKISVFARDVPMKTN